MIEIRKKPVVSHCRKLKKSTIEKEKTKVVDIIKKYQQLRDNDINPYQAYELLSKEFKGLAWYGNLKNFIITHFDKVLIKKV